MVGRYELYDVVVLINGVPEVGVPPGARGAIVDVHTGPTLAYEVEVVDETSGSTVWWGPVGPDDIRPADS